ncbi:unnamed protein product [Victoria cruziana]
MGPPVVTPEEVLETLMNDGTIDAIRSRIINQLKANEELKNTTISMVEQSKVLRTPGAEKQTKRELFDAIRRELETPVLEKASKAVWELILDNNGLGKEITETVEKVYYRLSGQEPPAQLPPPLPPLPPPPPPPPPPLQPPPPPPPQQPPPPPPQQPPPPPPQQPANGTHMERNNSLTPLKKRNFAQMSTQGVGEGTNGSML